MELDDLERTYAEAPLGPAPGGVYRGRFLRFLSNAGAGKLWVRAMDTLLFRLPTFGLDFDRQTWWFVTPGARVGRFRSERAASRWRPTECYALTYDESRLPGPFKSMLYDEVKPLSADLLLGLGGMNAETGEGDHFFFTLERG